MELKSRLVNVLMTDTTTILDDSKKSFTSVLLDPELFGAISGLRLNNKKKTEILWIRAFAGGQDIK